MDSSQKRDKPFSVAAFLFMPQFRLSFQHFSFVLPVFIRTVAIMFEQAGLLPRNHPATLYGARDVRKYGFFELLGETWANLRSSRAATPYQWGLYIGVLMMVGFVILSAFRVLFTLSGVLVSPAAAQIFSHPTPGALTDINSIPNTGASSSSMFNHTVQTSGGHADLGIMVLDKILREGAAGKGGKLQNFFGSVLEVYNTAVLVIAGVMLFWAVLSIVVDTAKTGQVGGGRHNMVWAPIRIVFALALLIPLGSSGFSSGQYMVMKLAEWGSNLGSRGWKTYVDNVVDSNEIIATGKAENLAPIVGQYTSMWVCRIAYNAYAAQSGSLDPQQQIKYNLHRSWTKDGDGKRSASFENDAGVSCGTISFVKGKEGFDKFLDTTSTIGHYGGFFGGSVGLLTGGTIAEAISNYRVVVSDSYTALFINKDSPGTEASGLIPTKAKEFACGFVAQHILPGADGYNPLTDPNVGCVSTSVCGAIPPAAGGPGKYPDASCMQEMSNEAFKATDKAISENLNKLQNKIPTSMKKSAEVEGWAAMGRWYHQISSINTAVDASKTPSVSILAGTVRNSGGPHASTLVGKVEEVQQKYGDWWKVVPVSDIAHDPSAFDDTQPWEPSPKEVSEGSGTIQTAVEIAGDSLKMLSPLGLVTHFTGMVYQRLTAKGNFFFNLASDEGNTYPIARLTQVGHQIIGIALLGLGALTAIQIGLGLLGVDVQILGNTVNLGDIGITAASSVLFGAMGTIFATILLAGLFLTFYIPMIPLVRTVFSVLTWMTSVFEAVVMVPIAALAHITTEGEGLAGGAKQAWVLWLNVLLRPILTVIGYIAALLIFNTFVIYFHKIFVALTAANLSESPFTGIIFIFSNTIIYVGVVYLAANSTFKLLDLMPNAMMKYLGGQVDHSFDEHEAVSGFIMGAGQAANSIGGGIGGIGQSIASRKEQKENQKKMDQERDQEKAQEAAHRAKREKEEDDFRKNILGKL